MFWNWSVCWMLIILFLSSNAWRAFLLYILNQIGGKHCSVKFVLGETKYEKPPRSANEMSLSDIFVLENEILSNNWHRFYFSWQWQCNDCTLVLFSWWHVGFWRRNVLVFWLGFWAFLYSPYNQGDSWLELKAGTYYNLNYCFTYSWTCSKLRY